MAGFGTNLTSQSVWDELIVALLRSAQRRAKDVGLRMHYRRYPTHVGLTDWLLTVDGNGFAIAAWSQMLGRVLPDVADGYTGPGAGKRSRNVAVSLAARWTDGCVGESDNAYVTASGRDLGTFYWPVLDVPEPPDPLEPRLRISDELIGRWVLREIPEEVAIEELHTAIEGLLRRVLETGRGPTFPQLASRAAKAGHLTRGQAVTLTDYNLLHRNRLKHQALALSDDERKEAQDLMWLAIQISDRLIDCLPA